MIFGALAGSLIGSLSRPASRERYAAGHSLRPQLETDGEPQWAKFSARLMKVRSTPIYPGQNAAMSRASFRAPVEAHGVVGANGGYDSG